MSENNYEKIINLPRPVSKRHRPMSISDRAAQFSAFAALTGYSDEISEKGRQTEEAAFVSEEQAFYINEQINMLIKRQKERPRVTIRRFVKDELKPGGREETLTVTVRLVDTINRLIVTDKNEKIAFDSILDIV